MPPEGSAVSAPALVAPWLSAPLPTLDAYRAEAYQLREIDAAPDAANYERLLRETYEPLGFMRGELLPVAGSRCYKLMYRGTLVAIFRLTPVLDGESPYFRLVPGARSADGRRARMVEVNNVVIAAPFRATILLGLLLYHCAVRARRMGCDFVVGLTRYQTLRFFVDFGVVPVDHPPLRLLGQAHLLDFVIYYDIASRESLRYLHERARRYFHQQYVMKSIQQKYVDRARTPPAAPPTPEEPLRAALTAC